jgi:hypothetical protein
MREALLVRLMLGPLFLICLLVILYLRKRKAARLLKVIGALHVLGGLVVGREHVARIFREGFFGEADSALGGLPTETGKELVFWFLLWGVFAFLLGQLVSYVEGRGLRPPAYVGWELAAVSLLCAALMPAGGFWLVLVPAFLLIKEAGPKEG